MEQEEKTALHIDKILSKYKNILSVLVIVAILIVFVSIGVGYTLNSSFYWGLISVFPISLVGFNISGRLKKLRYLAQIRNDWGIPQVSKKRDFKAIKMLFDNAYLVGEAEDFIDDQTWNDLNMDHACIKTAKELSLIKVEGLEQYTTRLGELFKTSRKILKKARFLLPVEAPSSGSPADIVFEYLNIFFLLEVRAFYSATDEINRQISELQELYLILGELDALQSVASYRASLASFMEPEFIQEGEEGIHLEVKDARHPLLDSPVPTSIAISQKGVIITGSNMSGKSTFLRNIGCNVLMAQTIATCLTSYYRSSCFRVMTSISRTDDVVAGKSFYYVEAERILRTIQSLSDKIPTLCIIDELLSGTNSAERVKASEAIIRYLVTQNALVIVATHDLELVERLDGSCDLYHFTDTADATGLRFDYLLKPGVATTHNAITLLRYLGYPKEIVNRASQRGA